MKKKTLILFCIVLGVALTGFSQQAPTLAEIRAAAVGAARMQHPGKGFSISSIATVHTLENAPGQAVLLYEVPMDDGTTILLSGSKAYRPVLGCYQSDGTTNLFDTASDQIPDGLKDLVLWHAGRIAWCLGQDTLPLQYLEEWNDLLSPSPSKSTHTVVSALLTTKWGQDYSNNGACDAYNYYVGPTANSCGCSSDRCPVGCGAVAMGQVMKYWNYPVYQPHKTYQYDWCNMPDRLLSYTPNYVKERNAVARLLKDCADAAETNFCVQWICASSTLPGNIVRALQDFGYDDDADKRWRSSYKDKKWIGFLKGDLDQGRPVIYISLSDIVSAHIWVVDGYDSDDKFHMNWGWWGSYVGDYEGYFALDGLKNVAPSDDDPNGSNYNNLQRAVFNIYPSTANDYCAFTFPLAFHYNYWTNVEEADVTLAHLAVPRTFTTLESVPAGSGIPAAWHTIETGQVAEYVAHETVTLRPGFVAKAGSHFAARIEPCASCLEQQSMLANAFPDGETYSNLSDTSSASGGMSASPKSQRQALEETGGLRLVPNPNDGTFTLAAEFSLEEVEEVAVFNAMGELLFRRKGCPAGGRLTLPSPVPGIHIVRVSTRQGVFVRKMVVR